MFLLNEKAPRLFESREIAASFVAPLLVAATTYALSTFFLLPPVFAYLPAINFITAIMFFLVAGTRRGHRPSPPEVTLLGLAMCGGAPILLLLLVLTRTRLRAEGIILLIFSAFLMQAILIKKYYPLVYDRRAWAMYLSAAEMQRIHIPLFGDLP
jgi:hypothetical protein